MQMRMQLRFCLTLMMCLLLISVVSAQVNPCKSDVNAVSANPTKFYVELPDYQTTLPGDSTTPLFKELSISYLRADNGAPLGTTKISRATFVAVNNAPDCYSAVFNQVDKDMLPKNTLLKYSASATGSDGASSPAPAPSNSFYFTSPPRVGQTRTGQ